MTRVYPLLEGIRTDNRPIFDIRIFLKLIDNDKMEKVTFSTDGKQLLGVDVDGDRLKIEVLPNDPSLLNQLTQHKVK